MANYLCKKFFYTT